jgi:serine/threonine protein phosphatase PrpC
MNTLQLQFGGYSTRGVKDENQDALAAFQPDGALLQHKGAIACIADGLSSSEHAKEASTTCSTMFIKDYLETPQTWSVQRSAAHIVNSLNSWCFAQSTPAVSEHTDQAHSSFLTTLSSVVFKANQAFVFHVGDSRVYYWHQQELEQLTRDHKQRQGGHTYLTRAIGIDPHIDVDLSTHTVHQGGLFLLSTDGLHDVLSRQAISDILHQTHINLEVKAKALVQAALEHGSDDNVSCLLVKVIHLPKIGLAEKVHELSKFVFPPALQPGNTLEGYRVLEILFEGTRSSIYKVMCADTKNIYALKAPSPYFQDDPSYMRSFSQEQWIGQQIDHENVMKILPRKANSQFLYHVCELIEGQTLRQWMIDNPKPSLAQVRDLLRPIISALRKMQRLDMTHRDLKPENIMVTHTGQIKLVDFGTIRAASLVDTGDMADNMTDANVAVGSVNYVAPESVMFNEATHTSDLFSLAAITYELLVGKLPYKPFRYKDYRPKSYSEWHYRPIHHDRSDLPVWVDMTLRKATAPNPTHRYQAFSEFLTDLAAPNDNHLNAIKNAPLLDRDPLKFWKLMCVTLLVVNALQLFTSLT